MNYEELVEKVESLPDIDKSTSAYFIERTRGEKPGTALITLIAQSDGSYTAALGDLRSTVVPALDRQGRPLVFSDENSACEWAWQKISKMRTFEPRDPQKIELGLRQGVEMEKRLAEYYAAHGFGAPGSPATDQKK